MTIFPDSNDFCVDCKVDTLAIGEYYSVLPDVWASSGLAPRDGMLCIGCLENRLGYILQPHHFSSYPINIVPLLRSSRLMSRLSLSKQTHALL